ncbi:MAG: rod shape-determining protein [Candidatus Saccharimonadales bacterium]|nr:rod shape-determining protein [Candidatus Saccharimonadales bacterium]
MSRLSKKMAIDMGTSFTRIYTQRKGVVVNEPSVVAKNRETNEIVAVGYPAVDMVGRTPQEYEAFHPLQHGVIADYRATQIMLKEFISRAVGRFHITKPEAMIVVSAAATSTEQRAVIDVGRGAGLHNVYLIKGATAAALGAGIPVIEPRGNMIIDIGAGTTEIAIHSLGGVVAEQAIRTGGSAINDAIVRYARRDHGLLIGTTVGEEIKQLVGTLANDFKDNTITARGLSVADSLPKSLTIGSKDIRKHLEASFEKMLLAVRNVLEQTPPDIISDIVEDGIVLSGGTAQLNGIEEFFSKKLKVSCRVSQDPSLCCVKGANLALTHVADYKKSLLGI